MSKKITMTNNTTEKVKILGRLSQQTDNKKLSEEWQHIKLQTITQNPWFTGANIEKSMQNVQSELLSEEKLNAFLSKYKIPESFEQKRIGLILAGNIPMVGIHDIIMVYLSGHKAVIKYSDKDMVIIPWLLKNLVEIDPKAAHQFETAERMINLDAVIATGSDNSARYFEAYFGKYPNIIRKNRSSIAVLSKSTSEEEMRALMKDVLDYFGLGCRNISKLYLEKGFDIQKFLGITEEYKEINNHNKYRNNYDYNLSLFLLNKQPFLQSGTLIMLEDQKLASRIATLHYEWFENLDEIIPTLIEKKESIQCMVSNMNITVFQTIEPGKAQCPAIDDFADNIDTFKFLIHL